MLLCFTSISGFVVFYIMLSYGKDEIELAKYSQGTTIKVSPSFDALLHDLLKSGPSGVESFANLQISGTVMAIGDLHGDLENARIVLRMAGVMNKTDD